MKKLLIIIGVVIGAVLIVGLIFLNHSKADPCPITIKTLIYRGLLPM